MSHCWDSETGMELDEPEEAGGDMRVKGKQQSAAPPIGERLLTLCEVAELLRLSTRTVRGYVRRGEINGRLIGRRWRFRPADIDLFYEKARYSWDFDGN